MKNSFSRVQGNCWKAFGAIAAFFGFNPAQAQSFEAPVDSVFGLPTDLNLPILTSADLDNDGDFDLIITERSYSYGSYDYTRVLYYQNVGTAEDPLFSDADENLIPIPVAGPYQYVYLRNCELADLDGDGDFDLLLSEYSYDEYSPGEEYHKWFYFENIGSPENPQFAEPVENPFNLQVAGYINLFDLGDIDGDGDIDLIGQQFPYDYNPGFSFQENIGTVNAPNFAAVSTNPFGLAPTDAINVPELGDIDGDGDLDLISTGEYGDFYFFENTGSANSPAFAAPSQNSLGLVSTDGAPQFPLIQDVDNDGDLDILSGVYDYYDSTINFHKNNLITSLQEISDENVRIFPNPVIDVLSVQNQSEYTFNRIQILDLNGKLVFDQSMNSKQKTIQLEFLESATYLLVLSNNEIRLSKKIIKK
ncbi:MAG: T9SS type A sorting domain-containing protein [Bacteroidota bacterium]